MDDREKIRVFALQNAVKFKGTASKGPIIGKAMGSMPEWRQKKDELAALVDEVIEEVNSLSPEEQQRQLEYSGVEEQKKEKQTGLKELKNAERGKVVMRLAPSPSGPFHLGHAITGNLTSLYTEKYEGTFILRIEDTNSDNIYPPAYEQIPRDADWVFGNVSEVWIQSDRLEIYYQYVKRLIEGGHAYVCTCSPEAFKAKSDAREDCPCRSCDVEEHLGRWQKMLDGGFAQGEAVLRFKADMTHPNPAMRDFPLARINETPHPRQGTKYRVWPLMNLSVTIDDIEAGMTHIIRGKDHADNAKRQELMHKALGNPIPETYFAGRIKFIGLELSCSKTKKKIEEGVYDGWEDIRLPFMQPLRRRGYQPGAFKRYALEMGLSKADKTVDADEFFASINAYNKEIIEPIAKRFFFVKDPVQINVKGAPGNKVTMDLHPDMGDGQRVCVLKESLLISEDDRGALDKESICRLKDGCTITGWKTDDYTAEFEAGDYHAFRDKGGKLVIHWLPAEEEHVRVEVMMPDKTLAKGLGEKHLADHVSVGDIVQFERFGFCRLDSIEGGVYRFWFCHS